MNEILAKLDELIAAVNAASAPQDLCWIDAERAAALLGFKPRYFLEKVSLREDFPTPMRIDGKGHPRWLLSEVVAWANSHKR